MVCYLYLSRTIYAMARAIQSEVFSKWMKHYLWVLSCSRWDFYSYFWARKNDIPNPSTYFNRKGIFAINLQTLFDASHRFLFISALTPGSTHDSTAFAMSALLALLISQEKGQPPNYWITADEVYVCSEHVISQWPGRKLSQENNYYNYWQFSARFFIEQAFEVLIGRWGTFWRPLQLREAKVSQVISACCKLHNFFVDNSDWWKFSLNQIVITKLVMNRKIRESIYRMVAIHTLTIIDCEEI